MNAKRTLLIATASLVVLVAPPNAAAKSMYGLKLNDSITVQGAIAPTLFAGRDCVEVVDRIRGDGAERTEAGVTEIEAERPYWTLVMYEGRTSPPAGAQATLVLRDLERGRTVRTESGIYGSSTGATATFNVRFPRAGAWSVALEDGIGGTHDFAGGIAVSTVDGPTGEALTTAELDTLGGPEPSNCAGSETSAASAGTGGSSIAPLAIVVGAVGVIALALILRRRTLG